MDMFTGAKHIMQWLADCAAAIAKENSSVQWTTPLGLPVIQPYRCPLQLSPGPSGNAL